jgi:hypothetical protein
MARTAEEVRLDAIGTQDMTTPAVRAMNPARLLGSQPGKAA